MDLQAPSVAHGHRMSPRNATRNVAVVVTFLLMTIGIAIPMASLADHESDNRMVFEPVEDSPKPGSRGTGEVMFHGGAEPESRWTATFQFTGLDAGAPYTVAVQGRFGVNGTADADTFTAICAFQSDSQGNGGCWYYFLGLKHLGIVQVRETDLNGAPVLQATRAEDGPGSINSTTNEDSLALTPAGQSSPAAAASPAGATPEAGTPPEDASLQAYMPDGE